MRSKSCVCVIKECSQVHDTGFWCPTLNTYGRWDWCEELSTCSCIGGSADAAILRSLFRKALTVQPITQAFNQYNRTGC